MINGINITAIKLSNGHNLLALFDLLPDIKDNLKLSKIEVKDFFTGEIKETNETFEDILKLVSNDFLKKDMCMRSIRTERQY